ncbi:hypothetical protein H8B13_18925 [Hymenobacter sp. BT188]|uniref:hypothetical protein n=1 Tax=Hymenobacter sp. BT188 TaxID=2763504 RepID=UPI0016513D25|nr:hypothetical protein [Hymenobacter sp. BT188]MBC6608902.1 hypothetical protein [Hymenobacter sp. BT188]
MEPLESTTPPTVPAVSSGIPEGVVNVDAWQRMQELKAHPLYSGPERIVRTSIDGLEIDLQTSTYNLKLKLVALPQQEQQNILALHAAASSIKGKIGGLTSLAYGGRTSMSMYAEVAPVLDPRKAELIELFGNMHTVEDVHEIITKDWGYQLSIGTLRAFKARHLEAIKARQEEVKHDPSGIRLGYKPMRMEELTWVYKMRKAAYIQNPSIANERQLQSILEQIRKEMEGEVSTVNIKADMNINILLDPVLRKQMLQQVSILDIIIARVAARMGQNPQYLMARLQTSLYAKFTGGVPATQEEMDETPIYPSQFVYDWDKIKAEAPAREAADKKLKEWPTEDVMSQPVAPDPTAPVVPPVPGETPSAPKNMGATIREQLKLKIAQMKEDVNRNADKISQANQRPEA